VLLKQRSFRILAVLVLVYALLILPGFVWPAYFESPAGLLVLAPILSVYLFHKIGVPGLLEHNGLCGWGWCAPTAFGWVFLVAFWVGFACLIAWGIGELMARAARRESHDD
jgi:hypothetical protein